MSSKLFDVITPNLSLNFMNGVKNPSIKNIIINGLGHQLIHPKQYTTLKQGVVVIILNRHHLFGIILILKLNHFI